MKVATLCALILFVSVCYCRSASIGTSFIGTSNYENLSQYVFNPESTYSVSDYISALTWSIPSTFTSDLDLNKDARMYYFKSMESSSEVLSASLMLFFTMILFF